MRVILSAAFALAHIVAFSSTKITASTYRHLRAADPDSFYQKKQAAVQAY
jgi:hypothetical protein